MALINSATLGPTASKYEVILITSLYKDFFVFATLVVYKLGILSRRKWV